VTLTRQQPRDQSRRQAELVRDLFTVYPGALHGSVQFLAEQLGVILG